MRLGVISGGEAFTGEAFGEDEQEGGHASPSAAQNKVLRGW